jgi:hypothetical protein
MRGELLVCLFCWLFIATGLSQAVTTVTSTEETCYAAESEAGDDGKKRTLIIKKVKSPPTG